VLFVGYTIRLYPHLSQYLLIEVQKSLYKWGLLRWNWCGNCSRWSAVNSGKAFHWYTSKRVVSTKNLLIQGPCHDLHSAIVDPSKTVVLLSKECPVMFQIKLCYTVACTLLSNVLCCVFLCLCVCACVCRRTRTIPSLPPFTLWCTCIASSWRCYSTIDSGLMKTGQLQGCSDSISSVGNSWQRSSIVWFCSGMPATVPVVTSLLLCPEQFWNGFYLNKLSFLVSMCFEQHGTVPTAINSTNMSGM